MGDWNFVEEPTVDRISSSTSGIPTTSDAPSKRAWDTAAPGAVDAYRLLHPHRSTSRILDLICIWHALTAHTLV